MSDKIILKASHCAWQIHYHSVFSVKYRRALSEEDVVKIIAETALQISERYEIEFERIGYDQDNMHLLCSAHPKTEPGWIVTIINTPPQGAGYYKSCN